MSVVYAAPYVAGARVCERQYLTANIICKTTHTMLKGHVKYGKWNLTAFINANQHVLGIKSFIFSSHLRPFMIEHGYKHNCFVNLF